MMMVTEVAEEFWSIAKRGLTDSIFFDSVFLRTLADSFNYGLHYLVVSQNNSVQAIAAVFSRNNEIVIPLTFTYTSLTFNPGLSERKYLEALQNLLRYMQERWKKIQLRIGGGEIADLRPFIWSGFHISPRFTYVKDVSDTKVHPSVEQNFKKALAQGLSYKTEKPSVISIERNLTFLTKQGLSVQEVKPYYNFFQQLAELRILVSYNAYQSDKLICSNLVLVDRTDKIYTLLIHPSEVKDVHTYLYMKGLEWAEQAGLSAVDFCGGNIERIANFKSYFKPELQPYFIVSYDEGKHRMKLSFEKMKKVVKRILGRG